jgi:DME family drug/metabolite transporter
MEKTDLLFPWHQGGYGFSHTLRKMGLNTAPDPALGVLVLNTAAFGASLLYASRNRGLAKANWKISRAWWVFGISGVLSVLGQLFLFMALNVGKVVIVAPLASTSPLFVILLNLLFFRKSNASLGGIVFSALLIMAGTAVLFAFPNL